MSTNNDNNEISITQIKQILTPQINKAKALTYINTYLTNKHNNTRTLTPSHTITTHNNTKYKHKRRYSDSYYTTPILSYNFLSSNPKYNYEEHKNISYHNITPSKHNPSSLYDKHLVHKILKETFIEEQLAKQLQNDLNLLKQPSINKHSLYLCSKNKSLQQPIYKRVNEIIDKRQTNLNKIKLNVNIEIANKCKQFINSRYNKHNFKVWIEENEEWNMKKKEKMEMKRELSQRMLCEEEEKFTFMPCINKSSEEIINGKMERSMTFRKKYEGEVGERLYKDGVKKRMKGKGKRKGKECVYEIEDI